MPKLSKEFKSEIDALSHKELVDIVLKMASKEKTVYEYININYIDKESGEQELFEKAQSDITNLFNKGYKGREQQKDANMISACVKRVNEFTKTSRNKRYEDELLFYVLDNTFDEDRLGTCFTVYDTRLASLVKRAITLVTKTMHHDYLIEYKDRLNFFLKSLHNRSRHLDMVYNMPKSID